MFKRLIASLVCLTFSFSNLQYVHAQASPATGGDFSVNQLPVPGTMVGVSTPFAPLALKGLIVNLQKPLEFQFIVDTGRGPQDTVSIKDQANQLVKYFLAGLTIPEGDLWVNLSPYEKDRMVPSALGQTDLGRDLLAQDYILKQLTASLIYPEKDLGKEFWSRVYAKAQKQFGTTNIPVNTFNKVWILPDQAQVFENRNAAYVTKSTLKVMLDEDYLAKQKHTLVRNDVGSIGANIVREIVIPEITKEVNTGKNFAPLRQIYQALILAKWYKETIQNGLLEAVYTNKNKVAGVNLSDPAVKEQIYNRYLQAYKKGAFNYIKEDPVENVIVSPQGEAISNRTTVPRKYFSGGVFWGKIPLNEKGTEQEVESQKPDGAMISLTVGLVAAGVATAIAGGLALRSIMPTPNQKKNLERIKADVRERLIARQPVGAKGNLLDFEQQAYKYALKGYDFEVIYQPRIVHYDKPIKSSKKISLLFGSYRRKLLPIEDRYETTPEVLYIKQGAQLSDQAISQTLKIQDAAMLGLFYRMYSISELSALLKAAEDAAPAEGIKDRSNKYYRKYNAISDELFRRGNSAGEFRYQWVVDNDYHEIDGGPFHNFIMGKHEKEGTWIKGPRFDQAMLQTQQPPNKDVAMKVEEAKKILFGKRILLVDDREGDFFKMILEEAGMTVEVADDGTTALELLNSRETSEKKFNFVLSDLNMVHMGGEKLAQQIRGSEKSYANVPMLIHSDGIVSKEVEFAKGSGVKMVGKGIESDELIIAMATELNSDAAMLVKLTVLRINMMSDVNKITIYLNDADSDIRKAAMDRLDKLATDSDLQYEAGLAGIKSAYSDVVDWAFEMFFKLSRGKEERDHSMLQTPTKDKAALANSKVPGGIDFNQINVLRKGKTVNVQFDPAQLNALEQGGFEGFTPVIINIQHISSPFQLLGINPTKQEVLAKV